MQGENYVEMVVLDNLNLVDLVVVLLAALLLFIFGRTDRELSRREGIIMLITVIVYYIYLFVI